MADLSISDAEIEGVERLLLPKGRHFDDDARAVIRRWETVDVVACPGSGKTTVLLAKLKLLADRMPLEGGVGACVLSHTNVAVDEIGSRFPSHASRLLGHPNYVGTIQSFVDRFLVAPYFMWRYGVSVRPVDDDTFNEMLYRAIRAEGCHELVALIRNHSRRSGRGLDECGVIGTLHVDDSGALVGRGKTIARPQAPSAIQFARSVNRLLSEGGVIRYADAYRYASKALDEMPGDYAALLRARFPYVFVDEYQDCGQEQRAIIGAVFGAVGCHVMRIGDPDQAIYASYRDGTTDWVAGPNSCKISGSNRYGQRIADVLSPLRVDGSRIVSACGEKGLAPVLIVYDESSIGGVPGRFAAILKERGLDTPDAVVKAIGFIGSADTKGTSVGSYWDGFGKTRRVRRPGYWDMVAEVDRHLASGAVYRAEPAVRRLLCEMLWHAGVRETRSGMKITPASIRGLLGDWYYDRMLELSASGGEDLGKVDHEVRCMLADWAGLARCDELLGRLPPYFMERIEGDGCYAPNQNVYVDSPTGVRIEFDTVHGVKGETHDATLYLETETHGASDIKRVLQLCGIGRKTRISDLHRYCRKVVYVGLSRPRKLLCVAVRSETYEFGKDAINGWEIDDIRH